jgi:hypothetical protein
MQQNDKNYLKDFAKKVLVEIKDQQISKPFIPVRRVKVNEVRSDGWAVELGTLRGYACSVEVWFDKFASHGERKLYYVLYSRKPEGIKEIATLSRQQMGKPIQLSLKDWADDNQYVHLKKRFTRKEFGVPVFETYAENKEYFYGIYEFEKFGLQRNETKRLISRVADFVDTINETLQLDKLKQDADVYKGVENRKAVKRHLQRERKSHLVTLRKQLDNFVCQICGFDYRRKYGKLGDEFAEAHHVMPLGKNEKQRTTTVDDLITVCANCHRILHRMNGTANDIPRLRRIIKQTK